MFSIITLIKNTKKNRNKKVLRHVFAFHRYSERKSLIVRDPQLFELSYQCRIVK